MTIETARAVLLRYTRDGAPRRGSGLLVNENFVLTADHCANGIDYTAIIDGKEYDAIVVRRTGSTDVDLAVVSVAGLPAVEPLPCALVDNQHAAAIPDCIALGFPKWRDDPTGNPRLAQTSGRIPTAEGISYTPTGKRLLGALKVTDPMAEGRPILPDLEAPNSQWAGMSGAVIVTAGRQIVGVVHKHSQSEGMGSLAFTPLAAIDRISNKETAEALWRYLGVHDPAKLPVLPPREAPAPDVLVVGGIPRQPPAFIQRETVQRLVSAMEGSGLPVVCTLTGLRGMGKTQIAAAYARSRASDGGLVGWVNAESRNELLAGLARIASRLGVADPDGDSLTSAQRLREHLQTRGGAALVVFDNAADPDGLAEFLPAVGNAQVVITSTDRAFSEFGHEVDVMAFSRAESVEYLRQRTNVDDDAGAAAVAAALGDLPVALAQAAATVRGRRLTYSQYLQRLVDFPVSEVLRRVVGQGYPYATAAALLLSIETVENEDASRVSEMLLPVVAVLSPDGVARGLLYGLDVADTDEPADGAVDAALEQCVQGSVLSWSSSGDSVVTHGLLGRVLREREHSRGTWAATVARAVNMLRSNLFDQSQAWALREFGSDLVSQIEALWEATAAEPPGDDLMAAQLAARYWAVQQLWFAEDLNRAVDLGLRVAADSERILGAQHPYSLAVRDAVAGIYQSAGRVEQAIATFQGNLADCERVLGVEHPNTVAARHNLAGAYRAAGRVEQAIALYERTLDDRERILGAEDPHTLITRHNLAATYSSAGRLDEAIALYERCLADSERILGPEHPGTLTTRDSLAGVYASARRLPESRTLHERTLADRERILGAEHPDTLRSRDNVAGDYASAGRLNEATAMFERTLTDRERILGTEHLDTLTSRDHLADVYMSAGRLDEAIALGERNFADRERVLSSEHPDTLTSAHNLAHAYASAGRLDEAIALGGRTLADRERILGPDSPLLQASSHMLADAYCMAGRLPEAIALYERSLADCERILGPEHPDTLMECQELAGAYRSARQFDKAIPLYRRILTDSQRLSGAEHPETIIARSRLADAYLSAGRLNKAMPLYQRAVGDCERVLGAEHRDTLASRLALARAYQSAGRLDDAIAQYEPAVDDCARILGPDDPATLTGRNNLAGAYRAAGRVEEAIPLYEHTLADRERILGPEHSDTLASRNNLALGYQSAGRLDEAIALFERNVADSERILGTGHPDTLAARDNLARAYQSTG